MEYQSNISQFSANSDLFEDIHGLALEQLGYFFAFNFKIIPIDYFDAKAYIKI